MNIANDNPQNPSENFNAYTAKSGNEAMDKNIAKTIATTINLLIVGGVALVLLAIGIEYFSSPKDSIIVKIGERFGEAEAAHIEASVDEEVIRQLRMELAAKDAEIYSEAKLAAIRKEEEATAFALQQENALIQAQLQTIQKSNLMRSIGMNIADIGCALETTGLYTEDDIVSGACNLSNRMRSDVTKQMASIIDRNKPNYVKDVAAKMPPKSDWVKEDYPVLQERYGEIFGHE